MKNIEKTLAVAAIATLLIFTAINYYNKKDNSTDKKSNIVATKTAQPKKLKERDYIIYVINNGSNRLGFKGGEMEGGYIPKDKAKDVACYLMSLRGKPCKEGFSQDAPLYFSSNCAGCHGVDAKGIKGSYPNLLREPFLGLEKR